MSIRNFTGFERGTYSIVGTGSIQGTTVRSGNYALRINPTTTGTGYFQFGSVTGNLNLSTLFARFYFQIATLPSSGSEELFKFYTSAGEVQKLAIRITSAGKLQIYDTSGAQIGSDSALTLTTGTWYRINAKCSSGNPSAYEIKIGDTVEFSGTANLNTSFNDYVRIGKPTNKNGQSVDFYYDDIRLDDGGHPYPGKCAILVPVGNGTYQTWTLGAGSGAAWERIDEVPPDGATSTIISTLVIGNASTFTVTNATSLDVLNNIRAVSLSAYTQQGGASSKYKFRIRSGGSDSDSAQFDPAGFGFQTWILTTNPITGNPFTLSELDAIEIGVVEDNNAGGDNTTLSAIYMEVEYDQPEAEKTQAMIIG